MKSSDEKEKACAGIPTHIATTVHGPAQESSWALWYGADFPGMGCAPRLHPFESGQVRLLALAPGGHQLFAVNTPDNRLEVFTVTGHGLTHRASIPVGLEPVAVAARSATEVWVVNHLSDSVSVVAIDPSGHTGRVVRTLLMGDEPRDIVFAGPGHRRAFITTAHRGQNVPYDPQLTTPGVGRADVWVFDAEHLGPTLGGTPLTIITLYTDTPRARSRPTGIGCMPRASTAATRPPSSPS